VPEPASSQKVNWKLLGAMFAGIAVLLFIAIRPTKFADIAFVIVAAVAFTACIVAIVAWPQDEKWRRPGP